MDDCTITRDGEQFVVAVDADRNTVTITDQYGKVGTITPSGGTLGRPGGGPVARGEHGRQVVGGERSGLTTAAIAGVGAAGVVANGRFN